MPGPIPNRSDNLSRERDANRAGNATLTKGTMRKVTKPRIPGDWDPIAKMVWKSVVNSGQSDFYQSSDYAMLYMILDEYNAYRTIGVDKHGDPYPTHKLSGQMFQTIMSALVDLGLSEGSRRRMRIELEKAEDEKSVPASVTAIETYKGRLNKPRGGAGHLREVNQEADRQPDQGDTGS
jgi:hypothetical protein